MEKIIKTKKYQFSGLYILLVPTALITSVLLFKNIGNYLTFVIFGALLGLIIYEIARWHRNKNDEVVLRFDNEGLTVLKNELAKVGMVHWEDIQMIGIKSNFWNNFLVVKVKNPHEYIDRIKADFKIKKKLKELNAKFQTPIVINIDKLDMESQKLRDLIKQNLK